MVVRFTWKATEWREAYLLSSEERDGASGPLPMGYLILGVMVLASVGDLLREMRHSREAMLHDSMSPMLLLVCLLAAAVTGALAVQRRRDRLSGLPALPRGEQQVAVHEAGWGASDGRDQPDASKVRPWSELRGLRTGHGVLALLTSDGTTVAMPMRALSVDQGSWLERLLKHKLSHFE